MIPRALREESQRSTSKTGGCFVGREHVFPQLGVRNTARSPCLLHIVTQAPAAHPVRCQSLLTSSTEGYQPCPQAHHSLCRRYVMRFEKDALQGQRRGYEVCGARAWGTWDGMAGTRYSRRSWATIKRAVHPRHPRPYQSHHGPDCRPPVPRTPPRPPRASAPLPLSSRNTPTAQPTAPGV